SQLDFLGDFRIAQREDTLGLKKDLPQPLLLLVVQGHFHECGDLRVDGPAVLAQLLFALLRFEALQLLEELHVLLGTHLYLVIELLLLFIREFELFLNWLTKDEERRAESPLKLFAGFFRDLVFASTSASVEWQHTDDRDQQRSGCREIRFRHGESPWRWGAP